MKEYTIAYCSDVPAWDKIPEIVFDSGFENEDGTLVRAKLAWNADAIHVLLHAEETNILARFQGECDPVWRDSCLEFFFCPVEEDPNYFNIECNPNGAMFWGLGKGREDRIRFVPLDIGKLFSTKVSIQEGGWRVEHTIPTTVIQRFFPTYQPAAGKKIRANLYGVTEDKVPGHSLMWSPITNGKRDFHQSAFFGQMVFGESK